MDRNKAENIIKYWKLSIFLVFSLVYYAKKALRRDTLQYFPSSQSGTALDYWIVWNNIENSRKYKKGIFFNMQYIPSSSQSIITLELANVNTYTNLLLFFYAILISRVATLWICRRRIYRRVIWTAKKTVARFGKW